MNLSNLKTKKQTIKLEVMPEIKQENNESKQNDSAEIIQLKKRILELEDKLRLFLYAGSCLRKGHQL